MLGSMNFSTPNPISGTSMIWAIPVVNLLFLLLLWMAISMAAARDERALPIVLPQAATAAERPRQYGDLTIEIDRDGKLYLEGKTVAIDAFASRLRRLAETLGGRAPGVWIRADARVEYGEIARLLDICREAGAERVWAAAETMGAP